MRKPTAVAGRRLASFLIDLLLLAVVVVGLWFLFTDRFDEATAIGEGGYTIGDTRFVFNEDKPERRTAWVVLSLLSLLTIFVLLPALAGRTPGKALLGLRIVGEDGIRPGLGRGVVRPLVGVVGDGFPYLLPGLLGFVLTLTTRANQRLGDMAANTYVVRREAAGSPVEEQLAAVGRGRFAPAAAAQPAPARPAPERRPGAPADWYPDPHGRKRLRYWDGERWTEHTAD